MTSHLGLLMVFALCVAVVFAALLRDEAASQLRSAARMFAAFVAGAYLLGWVLYGVFG
jgi:hypothetical protein